MKYLVTGGSGHLGANLVRRLLADGDSIRVLVRHGSDNSAFDGLDVEKVYGDLRNINSLRPVLKGMDRVYHVAAKISTLQGEEKELFDCNVLGTRNLLWAAREAGVGRIVVSGSFSAVGDVPDRPSNETVPFNPFKQALPYSKSKAAVEHECLKAVVEGQDVVIAVSCAILGPYDFKPSRMGRTLCDFSNGKLRVFIPGGFEFVAARDIAEGHVLAMEKGRAGQKYILSSGYVSIDDLMDLFSQVTGKRKPMRLSPQVMAGVSQVTHFILTHFFPKVPQRLTPGAVRILCMQRKADISKARNELGYQPTPIRDAIEQAYEFFVARGKIVRKTFPKAHGTA